MLALIVVLTLGATVVNGATDAPNAIATVVGTKAMRPGPAIAMAAVCNFVGLAAITMVSSAVALTIFKMVDFRRRQPSRPHRARGGHGGHPSSGV